MSNEDYKFDNTTSILGQLFGYEDAKCTDTRTNESGYGTSNTQEGAQSNAGKDLYDKQSS